MKGLFIGSYPNPVEPYRSVFFRELIYQMAETGVDVTVISCVSVTAYKGKVREIPEFEVEVLPSGKTVKVYRPRIVTYSAKKIGKWNTVRLTQKSIENAVIKQIKKIDEHFDFFYGHFFLGGGLTAAKAGSYFNIPSYIAYGECDFNTEVYNKYGDIKREQMESVKGIIAVSSANKRDVETRDFARDIPVLLCVNSINEKIFMPKDKADCRKKFGFTSEDFIVGFVGYFIHRKGPDRVLKACEGLDDVKLAFAGKGELEPKGDNVIFAQPLKHEEVADFLGAIDVFILPTLNEGCCNAVVEALACGRPIISSDLPFNHDVLNENNSILIDPNDIDMIRKSIVELKNDKNKCMQMSINALKTAEELTLKRRAENIFNFINDTM